MEYEMLKEMPRFWIQYGIKFITENNKEEILKLFNCVTFNADCKKEVLKEEDETFSINIEFKKFTFCGFSCSDAILHLFTKETISIFEQIIAQFQNEIKNISLSIECAENPLATRYYMHTDITGEAAKIMHQLQCDVYLDVGKDGTFKEEFQEICLNIASITTDEMSNIEIIKEKLKLSLKEKMKNKEKNFKDIILLKYALRYIK